MPELVHDCGKRVTFPSGTEGKRGTCPHCGGRLTVPGGDAPPPQKQIELSPPPRWDEYLAYLEDRGPAPRYFVMPAKLMLKAEADEKWDERIKARPSKYRCPSCRFHLEVDQLICTQCGLDLRSGVTTDGKKKLTPKGMAYLEQIPWVVEARSKGRQAAEQDKKRALGRKLGERRKESGRTPFNKGRAAIERLRGRRRRRFR